MTLDELFVPPPKFWGLRGDPRVWEAMREHLRGQPLPESAFEVRQVFEAAFTELVEVKLSGSVNKDDVVLREWLRTGSGMSDGAVSLHFWQFTGIPLLVDRWVRAEAAGPQSQSAPPTGSK